MKLNKKHLSKKQKITIVIVAVIIVIAGGVGAAAYYRVGPFSQATTTSQDQAPTDEQKQSGDSAKKITVESDQKSEGKGSNTGSDPLPEPTPTENGKSTVGAEISAANQTSSTLQVRTFIQTVSSSGVCNLSMTGPNGTSYSASAEVQAMPSSTTCKGFDIPLSSLSPGSWSITVNFESETLTASATKAITVN